MSSLTPLSPVTKLSSMVIRILGCNAGPMTLQGTNTYIVGNGPKRILIDTGEKNNRDYLALLAGVLKKENIFLEHIVITHWHSDHIGGLEGVLDRIGRSNKVWKYSGHNPRDVDIREKINFLSDGQEISSAGATLKVVHTPGHTTDHVSLLLKEENALFSGDCILGEGTAIFESLEEYLKSLERLLTVNPTKIYPGHGPVIEKAKEKIEDYIRHRQMREASILNLLSKRQDNSLSSETIVNDLYPGAQPRIQLAALEVVNQHLSKLLNEGKVEKVDDAWKINVPGGKL